MKRPLVLVTGVFDLLHAEHIAFLQKAKALGGSLYVGVECDARVKKIKGEGRPVQTAETRVQAIENLKIAEKVFVLPEHFDLPEQHRQLLIKILPDILAISSHTAHQPEKHKLMEEIGGTVVVVHPHNPAISTTQLLANSNYKEHACQS